jgi:SAM-dependent methyltransferase
MESLTHQHAIVSQFTRQSRPFAQVKAHSEQCSLEIFRELGHFSGNERVLDSGCGPGLVSLYLADFVREVTGVDLTPAMVELAAETALKSSIYNVSFLEGNMTALPFSSGQFDTSVTRYTFHHLENPQAAFDEMLRVTRVGGRIIVVDVAPEASKRDAYDHFERLRDPSHTSALTVSELENLGHQHGLQPTKVIRFGLEMDVHTLISASFPESVRREELIQLLTDDLDQDKLAFQMRREEGGSLTMTFPVTAASWHL